MSDRLTGRAGLTRAGLEALMLKSIRWSLFKVGIAVFCFVGVMWACLAYFFPAPPSTITIAAGLKGGAFEDLAYRYQERLARSRVKLIVRLTDGMLDNFRLVEDRSSGVDVAFIFGGVSNRKKSPDLVSLGRIYFAPIWFFYRGTETLDRLSQLKGKRIAVGPASRVVMDPLLAANGVNHASATIVSLVGSDAAKALQEGSIDVAPLPFELNSPIVQALLRDPEIRLMSLKEAEAVTRVFPHFARLVLPQGVIDLERNIPPSDVSLIALTNTVVIRNDLHPELIHLLAEALSEEHGGPGIFQRAGDFPTLTDPEFPIAQSALDFYRSGPSFLNKFLPFWITSYAKRAIAVLVAGFAIVLPLFSYAMTLYRWFVERHLRSIYQHLRDIEAVLKKDVTMSDVSTMESELAVIGRRISNFRVPMRLSDLFYSVKSHFDVVYLRLEMRRNELQGRAPTSAPS